MKLKIVFESDGSTDGSRIVDQNTGEEVIFEGAQYLWEAIFIPSQGGLAAIRLKLDDVPVVAPVTVTAPFNSTGEHSWQRPLAAT